MPRTESRRAYMIEEHFEIFDTCNPPLGRYAPPIRGHDYYGSYEVEESGTDAQGNWKCSHIYGSGTKSWHTIFKDGGHYFQFPDGSQGYYHPQRGSAWLRDHKSSPKRTWDHPESPCATEVNRPPLQWLTENGVCLPDAQSYDASRNMGRQFEGEYTRASFETQQYDESDYMESDYMESDYMESDYMESDYMESDYMESDYMESDDMESDDMESDYMELEHMEHLYPTDSELSYDEPEPQPEPPSLEWRSPPAAIPPYAFLPSAISSHANTSNSALSEWRQGGGTSVAMESRNPVPGEGTRPRTKQTARKSSHRKPVAKAQTTRKQTARKLQPTVKKETPKPKPKSKSKSKTPATKKTTPAKKSGQSKKGSASQETAVFELKSDKIHCRVEFGSGGSKK